MLGEAVDHKYFENHFKLQKEENFVNWRKSGSLINRNSLIGSDNGSFRLSNNRGSLNRKVNRISNCSNGSRLSYNNALQNAVKMMENNQTKRDSYMNSFTGSFT